MDITYSVDDAPKQFEPVTLHIKCATQAELDAICNVLDDPKVMSASFKVHGLDMTIYHHHLIRRVIRQTGADTWRHYTAYVDELRQSFGLLAGTVPVAGIASPHYNHADQFHV